MNIIEELESPSVPLLSVSKSLIDYFSDLYAKDYISFEKRILTLYKKYKENERLVTRLLIIIGLIAKQPMELLYPMIKDCLSDGVPVEIQYSLMLMECWRTKECLLILKETRIKDSNSHFYKEIVKNLIAYKESIQKDLEDEMIYKS